MKTTFLKRFSLLGISGVFLLSCSSEKEETTLNQEHNVAFITPVDLPDTGIPGFHFPEDSAVINSWMRNPKFENEYDSVSVYQHAWGLWAGLTAQSGQVYQGDSLLIFETWQGLNEIRDEIIAGNKEGGCTKKVQKKSRTDLKKPTQLAHVARFTGSKSVKKLDTATAFWVSVSYSPQAACFSTENEIFKQSKLNSYFKKDGQGKIPEFPTESITIKPTYMVYKTTDDLMRLPVWVNEPVVPKAYPNSDWNTCVYVDKTNSQAVGKIAIPIDTNDTNPNHIKAATVNLNDFIHFKLDEKMAKYMNEQDSIQGVDAKAGEIAVLVAMHVTTKEISNWTWQSFYWAPNPAKPGKPSSVLAHQVMPKQIKGAAAHYAVSVAYEMALPFNATNANGKPVIGYNPYLEADFGPEVFAGFPNQMDPSFEYGIQTNCMSCHAIAIASPSGKYSTDQVIDLNGEYFRNQVSLDFAWSVQTAIIADTIPYWKFTEVKK